MRTITVDELKEIIEKHKKWLNDEEGGERADLREANLSRADLQGTDLREADLRKADLQYAILYCADLRGSNLRDANLHCADLRGSDLRCASLRCASLQCANLSSANLSSANLSIADLKWADLRNANLYGANLYGARLRNVKRPWLVYAGNIGSRRSETLYFTDYDNVRCGCWNGFKGGTLAEFKERIDEVYPAGSKSEACRRYRIEYLSAIKMFKSMRGAYLESVTGEMNND